MCLSGDYMLTKNKNRLFKRWLIKYENLKIGEMTAENTGIIITIANLYGVSRPLLALFQVLSKYYLTYGWVYLPPLYCRGVNWAIKEMKITCLRLPNQPNNIATVTTLPTCFPQASGWEVSSPTQSPASEFLEQNASLLYVQPLLPHPHPRICPAQCNKPPCPHGLRKSPHLAVPRPKVSLQDC